MKELDRKFSDFEKSALQREKDYKHIIEQQRLDTEQLKNFETLKESNLELKVVSLIIISLILIYKLLTFFQKIQKLQDSYQNFDSPSKTPTKKALFLGKENQSPIFTNQSRLPFESPKNALKPRN